MSKPRVKYYRGQRSKISRLPYSVRLAMFFDVKNGLEYKDIAAKYGHGINEVNICTWARGPEFARFDEATLASMVAELLSKAAK